MTGERRGIVRDVGGQLHLEVPDIGLLPIPGKARRASQELDLADGDPVVALIDGWGANYSVRRIKARVGERTPVRSAPVPQAAPSQETAAGDTASLVNPYTFLPYVPTPPDDRHRQPEHRTRPASRDLLSGHLRLELGVRSPLAIFGRSTSEPATHATTPKGFLPLTDSVGTKPTAGQVHTCVTLRRDEHGRPIIPGSSLKGAARLWFEAITSSVRLLDESPVSWRAIAVSRNRRIGELQRMDAPGDRKRTLDAKPGWQIVELTQWEPSVTITPDSSSEEVSARLRARLEALLDQWDVPPDSAGHPLLKDGVEVIRKDDRTKGRLKVGVAQGDEPDVSVHVALCAPAGRAFPLDPLVVETWEHAHRHQRSGVVRATGGSPRRGEVVNGDRRAVFERLDPSLLRSGDLVWFEEENGRVTFFGRLRNDRWAAKDPVAKRVPKHHGAPASPDVLSPASIVFGTVGERKSRDAWAGRVRFGTGRVLGGADEAVATYTLRPLQTPKLSAAGFYLRPEKAGADSTSWAEGRDMLAGSKVYWHTVSDNPPRNDGHVRLARDSSGRPAKTAQNATVEAVTSGTFESTVWFEDLTATELGALLAACSLRFTEQDAGRGWKLGIGKPLGLGSVANRIKEVTIYGAQRFRDPTCPSGGVTLSGDAPEVRDYERNALEYFMSRTDIRETFDFIARLDSMVGRRVEYPPLGSLAAQPDGSRPTQPDAAEVSRNGAVRLRQPRGRT